MIFNGFTFKTNLYPLNHSINSHRWGVSIKRGLLIILAVVIISGCTSTDTDGNPALNYTSDLNNSGDNTTLIGDDNSSEPSKVKYDASGYCGHVVDGDTIDVEGVGRVRFVGVNTPERGQPGYREAKDFVISRCLGRTVQLDIDDARSHDRYGRVLAVVYVDGVNLNRELLRRGYAELMYIPPSEFDPYSWT